MSLQASSQVYMSTSLQAYNQVYMSTSLKASICSHSRRIYRCIIRQRDSPLFEPGATTNTVKGPLAMELESFCIASRNAREQRKRNKTTDESYIYKYNEQESQLSSTFQDNII